MAKSGSGAIAGAGRRKGQFVGWNEGLTDSDFANLEVIADNTDEVIEAIGIALGRSLEAVGLEAESDAAALCPVDTGRLRNSITHAIDGEEKAAYIGTNVEYAEYVHNGTSTHKPQPFLTDAVNQNADRYRQIFEEGMRNA